MDNEFPDVTDERDTFSPLDEPSVTDWAIANIESTISLLKQSNNTPYGYVTELTKIISDLSEILERATRPF